MEDAEDVDDEEQRGTLNNFTWRRVIAIYSRDHIRTHTRGHALRTYRVIPEFSGEKLDIHFNIHYLCALGGDWGNPHLLLLLFVFIFIFLLFI